MEDNSVSKSISSKYPWLKVDSSTVRDFESPFDWEAEDVKHRSKVRSPSVILRRKRKKYEDRTRNRVLTGRRIALAESQKQIMSLRTEQSTTLKLPSGFSKTQRKQKQQQPIPRPSSREETIIPIRQKPYVNKSLKRQELQMQRAKIKLDQERLAVIKQQREIQSSLRQTMEDQRNALPSSFLAELNLKEYARSRSKELVVRIFSKVRYKQKSWAFECWKTEVRAYAAALLRKREEERITKRGIELLSRLAQESQIGIRCMAFKTWHNTIRSIILSEQTLAARKIQKRFRYKKTCSILRELREISTNKEAKIQFQIKRFMAFHAADCDNKWTLVESDIQFRVENNSARRIQKHMRRYVNAIISDRELRHNSASKVIQLGFRNYCSRVRLTSVLKTQRQERVRRNNASVVIQCQVRVFIAKRILQNLKHEFENKTRATVIIQKCYKRFIEYRVLKKRFIKRRIAIEEQRERERLILWNKSSIEIQRVFKGFQSRKYVSALRRDIAENKASSLIQKAWRDSTGRHILKKRCEERRRAKEILQNASALVIQCAVRVSVATRVVSAKRRRREERRKAATDIQRLARGVTARRKVRAMHLRRRIAAIVIQSLYRVWKAKIVVRDARTARDALIRLRNNSATIIQKRQRGIIGRRIAVHKARVAALLRKLQYDSAVVIQRHVRGYQNRLMVNTLRKALEVLRQERQLYVFEESMPIEEAINTLLRGWLVSNAALVQHAITKSQEQLEIHYNAITAIQRKYRCYKAKLMLQLAREAAAAKLRRDNINATVIQRRIRGILGRKAFRRHEKKVRADAIKAAYKQERKAKAAKDAWKVQMEEVEIREAFRKNQETEAALAEAKQKAELARLQVEIALYTKQAAEAKAGNFGNFDDGKSAALLHWEECHDEYGGGVYYYNKMTHETSWEAPPVQESFVSKWEEVYDPTSQSNFYQNLTTGQIVWTRPAEMDLRNDAKEREKDDDSSSSDTDDDDHSDNEQAKPEAKEEGNAESDIQPAAAAEDDEKDLTKEDKPSDDSSGTKEEDNVKENPSKGITSGEKREEKPVEEDIITYQCWRCEDAVAVKECIGCSVDKTRNKYCSKCFVLEHRSGIKRTHEFRMLVAASATSTPHCAQCNAEATYHCRSCEEDLAYYCDSCFDDWHHSASASVDKASHDAMHFRKGSVFCPQCNKSLATRSCTVCNDKFCADCFTALHQKGRKKKHEAIVIEIEKEELGEDDEYCVECEIKKSSRMCNLCGDGYCSACYDKVHAKGHKASHTWVPWEEVVRMGDWVEMTDPDDYAKKPEDASVTYFNIVTKETVKQKPAALMTGVEKHQVLVDAEAAEKRKKEIETQAELVALREKLRQIEEEKRLAEPVEDALGDLEAMEAKEEEEDGKKPSSGGLMSRFRKEEDDSGHVTVSDLTPKQEKEAAYIKSMLMSKERGKRLQREEDSIGSKTYEANAVIDIVKEV